MKTASYSVLHVITNIQSVKTTKFDIDWCDYDMTYLDIDLSMSHLALSLPSFNEHPILS